MPRFYMHLVDSVDVLLDPDGVEMPSEKIADYALFTARDCMSNDVKGGLLDLGYRIEVHTDSGERVHSVEFKDALEITQSH